MTKELQDQVWSILPKEFKEEVKALYHEYQIYSCMPQYAKYELLINLFGHRNLTSDEGAKANANAKANAEPKFKVGDKVKTMDVIPKSDIGRVGVVENYDKITKLYMIDYRDNTGVCSFENDLEPYTEPTENANEDNFASKMPLSEPDNEVRMSGWVCREKNISEWHKTDLYLGTENPTRHNLTGEWHCMGFFIPLNQELFPSVTWESDPLEVELVIKPKKK